MQETSNARQACERDMVHGFSPSYSKRSPERQDPKQPHAAAGVAHAAPRGSNGSARWKRRAAREAFPKLARIQVDHSIGEPSLLRDQLAHGLGVELPQYARACAARARIAPLLPRHGGMKAEDRIARETNALARHEGEHQGACRKTPSVDNHVLAGIPNGRVSLHVAADRPSRIVADEDCCAARSWICQQAGAAEY